MTTLTSPVHNWAGNITFRAERLHRPTSVAQLQSLVAASSQMRVLGTGHSFNTIADTPGDLVRLNELPRTIEIDTAAAQVRVAGAVRYGELVPQLHRAGFALPNLGSLPHISIAGACATGTHGSGAGNGCLATQVSTVEYVVAGGELMTLRRGQTGFDGSVVALGALGAVTHLTLDLVPTFDVTQVAYDGLPREVLHEHLDEVLTSAYSVSVFTDHRGPATVWRKEVDGAEPADRWLGARLADGPRHPVPGVDPRHCTEQGAVAGPWHARLPHFRLEFTPSRGDELQSEYFVPREHALAALAVFEELSEVLAPVLLVCELRTVAADELWLSMAQGRPSLAVHLTWVPDGDRVTAVLAQLETRLAELGARPHWGKVFCTPPATVQTLYPRLVDYQRLRDGLDPGGVFSNRFTDTYLR